MRILIVEDDSYKSKAISEFINVSLTGSCIDISESLIGGLFKLESSTYDLILLDMSMPNYEISNLDPSGGTPESFAGEEFLSHMSLLGFKTPVIVITQYDNFGPDDQQMSLADLRLCLEKEYNQIYRGTVYFSNKSDQWKTDLSQALKETFK